MDAVLAPATPPPASPATINAHPAAPTDRADTKAMEQQMLALVNADRADAAYRAETRGRARPLLWDEELARVARAHAADMAKRNYFDHYTPEGLGPADRATRAGVGWHTIRENLAFYDDVAEAQRAFMAEPPFEENHRANILATDVDRVGIGIVPDADGQRFWIVQDFRTP